MAKASQQIVLAAFALQQQRQFVALVLEARLEEFVGAAHRAQAGAQEEGPAARGEQRWKCGVDDGIGIPEGIRLGHAERRVKHRLPGVIEGAFPARRFRLAETEFAAVVLEPALHGERRRGENPGARVAAHLLLENLGDIKWRRIELQRMSVGLPPAHVAVAGLLPFGNARHKFERALPALLQPFGALGLGFQDGGELRDLLLQRFEGRGKFWTFQQLTAGEAPGIDADRQPQIPGDLFHIAAARLQFEAVTGIGQPFGARVAHQIENLRGRHGVAEEQRGDFRQLVRLVEDHRVAGR